MPDFAYIARDIKGHRVSGTVSAPNERDAVSALSGQSLFPVEVSAETTASAGGIQFGRRIKPQLMSNTYSQLAALIRSGVPLLKAITILRDQTSNPNLKDVLDDLHTHVEEGTSLADAMARHPRAFSEMAINMVRAGGEGGFLEDALARVATFTDQQEDLKARTFGALAYPVFLATVGTLIVTALMVFFVPKFGALFDQLRSRGELPLMTEWLLWISASLRSYWGLAFFVVTIVSGLLIWARSTTEDGRRFRDLLKIRAPLLGSVFKSLAVARFCRVLGTLLRNGVPILRSLEISRQASGNRVLSEAIEAASENVTAGESLAAPLSQSGHFPVTVVEMISVAEESNTLDTVLVDVADDLEKRTFRRLDLVVRMIEPVMLLLLAAVVLCVVIALLLPVIKMSSTLS